MLWAWKADARLNRVIRVKQEQEQYLQGELAVARAQVASYEEAVKTLGACMLLECRREHSGSEVRWMDVPVVDLQRRRATSWLPSWTTRSGSSWSGRRSCRR